MKFQTGKMICANAGHEYPAIRRKNGQFELLKDRHGFVLAGMEDMKYTEYEITLEPGDYDFCILQMELQRLQMQKMSYLAQSGCWRA